MKYYVIENDAILISEKKETLNRYYENIKDKEVVIGKALIHIFDNHGKFNNIKVSIDNDFDLNDFLKCGFLIVEELTVFSNK